MAGLDPAIHGFLADRQDVDAPDIQREDALRALAQVTMDSCLAGPALHAVFAAFSPSFVSTASRIKNFWILPVTVIGNSSTNST